MGDPVAIQNQPTELGFAVHQAADKQIVTPRGDTFTRIKIESGGTDRRKVVVPGLLQPLAGAALTYHANCESMIQGEYSTSSNCQAYKGASGGAVVTYSATGAALFAGVISEGDSEGTSTFVPVSNFRSILNRYIR